MKKIIVTPAGRKRYLELLYANLMYCKDEFDSWDIWLNTENKDDIEFIENLASTNDFINIKYLTVPFNSSWPGTSIGSFFKDYVNPEEVYVRLDDDIIYIKKGSLAKLFDERIKDVKSFLLYGNIINNCLITHIHQRVGNFGLNYGKAEYACMGDIGWCDSKFAEQIHREFLDKYIDGFNFSIPNWVLYNCERVSINVIAWRGDEFAKFCGIVDADEEQFLSTDKPRSCGLFNRIIGDTLFVHFAFYTQREHLDKTNLLERYKELTNMKPNKITIWPTGGLCNRLRVVLSYLEEARLQNKELCVIWDTDKYCNGYFLDYFEPIDNVTFYTSSKSNFKVDYKGCDWHPDHPFWIKHKTYKQLVPLPAIQDKIKSNILQLGKNYISVHIRRTDHTELAKKNNAFTTDDEFFNFINNYNQIQSLYIATDNETTFNIFKSKYKSKIKLEYKTKQAATQETSKGAFDRFRIMYTNKQEPIRQTTLEQSIIDLFMCVYADEFKGSGWSSFTDTILTLRKCK